LWTDRRPPRLDGRGHERLFHLAAVALGLATSAATWTADHGNGTFSNALFYDEFSDPDMIRVGIPGD